MTRSYRELIRKLCNHDPRFQVFVDRGKGSHRMIAHAGTNVHYPIKYHGDKTEYPSGVLRDIDRFFELPPGTLT